MLQYLHVDCAMTEDRVPDLPKCFFDTETPTLFCLDHAFNCRLRPYNAEQHPMQYVCLSWLPPSSSNSSALSHFLLSLSSLRCIFLAYESHDSAGTRAYVGSLTRCLRDKGVDVRRHSTKYLITPVLPEFEDYIKMKKATAATA